MCDTRLTSRDKEQIDKALDLLEELCFTLPTDICMEEYHMVGQIAAKLSHRLREDYWAEQEEMWSDEVPV